MGEIVWWMKRVRGRGGGSGIREDDAYRRGGGTSRPADTWKNQSILLGKCIPPFHNDWQVHRKNRFREKSSRSSPTKLWRCTRWSAVSLLRNTITEHLLNAIIVTINSGNQNDSFFSLSKQSISAPLFSYSPLQCYHYRISRSTIPSYKPNLQ